MKLIIAIISSSDAPSLSSALIEANFSVTKLATTGGFLKQGNTTLLMGVDNEKVEEEPSCNRYRAFPLTQALSPPLRLKQPSAAQPFSSPISRGLKSCERV